MWLSHPGQISELAIFNNCCSKTNRIYKALRHTPSVCQNNLEFDDQTQRKYKSIYFFDIQKILATPNINSSMGESDLPQK